MKQIDETTKHRVFVAWVDFMEAILSSFDLKYDGSSSYSIPKILVKPGMTSQRFLLVALNKSYSSLATMI